MTTAARFRAVSIWERYVGGEGLTLTLAGLVAVAVSLPIQQARWVEHMPPAILVALVALVLAWALERSDLSAWQSHLIAFGTGALVVFVSAIIVTPGISPSDRLIRLFQELDFWLRAVPTDELRGGLVEFTIFILTVVWAVGYSAGWLALRRQQGWFTVLLGGLVVSVALGNIANHKSLWLALFMAASVLLLIHLTTARRMVGWRARRLSFDPVTVLSQSGFVLLAGLFVILLVSAFPTPRIAPLGAIADAIEGTLITAESHFSRLFNGLPSRQSYRTITYGDQTFFRGNPNLTDDLLFTVRSETGAYWRARTYVNYTSTGWETSDAAFGEFSTSTGLNDASRVPTQAYFDVTAATDTLFTGGLPLEFDQDAEALAYQEFPDDVLQVKYSEGREFFPTRTDLRYTSTGAASIARPVDLRGAGTDYPEWVTDRYLQLPPTLPQRVRDLAAEVGAGHDNVFDQIEAVRAFVIRFPYNLDIQAPPTGHDGVDYFLFDLQQGYCDYYASSLAVLLRTLEIPSRYVLGYASGQLNEGRGVFEVLDLNYHSWVEAYFPEFGWVIFEATPPNAIEFGGGSQSAPPPGVISGVDFGDGPFAEDEEEDAFGFGDFTGDSGFSLSIGQVITWAIVFVVLLFGSIWYRWWWRLSRFDRADELYAKMQRLAVLLGLPQRPEQTPREYAATLAAEMPDSASDIRNITEAYSGRRYAGRPLPMGDLRQAEEAWLRLRWVLIKRMFRIRPA